MKFFETGNFSMAHKQLFFDHQLEVTNNNRIKIKNYGILKSAKKNSGGFHVIGNNAYKIIKKLYCTEQYCTVLSITVKRAAKETVYNKYTSMTGFILVT